jgi:hypothetical protein
MITQVGAVKCLSEDRGVRRRSAVTLRKKVEQGGEKK